MPDRALNSLSSDFRPLAIEWIARCSERGVPVLIVQTLRTEAEHQINLANGTSSVTRSLHLPRRLRTPLGIPSRIEDLGKADAMDLAPFDTFHLHGPDKLQWDTQDPAWGIIGEVCEQLGLRWGGRWRDPFDPGHGELLYPGRRVLLQAERARPWPRFRTAADAHPRNA